MSKLGRELHSIREHIEIVAAGVAKLAEFSDTTSDGAVERATEVVTKLAEFGYGSKADVEANVAYLSSGHTEALEGAKNIVDLLGQPKQGSSPSQLGKPAGASSREPSEDAYRPPRC